MDEQFNNQRSLSIQPPDLIVKVVAATLGMLALFLLVLTISQIKQFHYIGSGVAATNTITVSGTGEIFAVPDRATFSVTVREEGKDVTTAQEKATKKNNDIIAYLKGAGVEEKDIKTTNYSINPKYEYTQADCRTGYCPPGKQTLAGFEVYQTLEVKVKDPKKAGELLSGVGSKGASEVSGLTFTIEDEDTLKSDARSKAIANAEAKADELADQLGVDIVRVVGYSENEGGYPVYYAKAMSADSGRGSTAAAPAPEIATGQNKITSNVSVTYEIR